MKKPKILLYDIETTPIQAWVWTRYPNGPVLRVEKDWELLSVSWKWLGERTTHFVGQDEYYEEGVVLTLAKQLEKADIVVTHNGVKFDNRKINAKIAQFSHTPLPPTQQVDTCRESKKYFGFSSNKLGDIGERLGLGQKVRTGGADLWFGCMKGDEKAWRKMRSYNIRDVKLLEKLYLKLRPYIENHPNMALLMDKPVACTKCGHSKLRAHGWRHTKTGSYRGFKCVKCGAYSQGTKRLKKAEVK